MERVRRIELLSIAWKATALPLCYTRIITAYRVTRKLTIKAGFVFNKLNIGLPLCSNCFQLVSDYNFDTVFTDCVVLLKLNIFHNVLHGFPSPSENSDYCYGRETGIRTQGTLLTFVRLVGGCFRPLSHLSVFFSKGNRYYAMSLPLSSLTYGSTLYMAPVSGLEPLTQGLTDLCSTN